TGKLLPVFAQGVETVAGFRGGPQPADAVAGFRVRRGVGEVDLVDEHHAFGAGGQGVEQGEVGGGVFGVGDQQGGVGAGEFAVGAAHAFAFDFVFRIAQARGVG